MKSKLYLKIVVSLLIIVCNVGCDQITKDKARSGIQENQTIQVIDDVFMLTKVENTGAAMSLGNKLNQNSKVFFLQIFPIFLLIGMFIFMMRKKNLSLMSLIAMSFIIGGGIGNIYDRVLYNSVTDFMFLQWGKLHTGIFNMADVSIVIGTVLLLIYMSKEEAKNRKASTISTEL